MAVVVGLIPTFWCGGSLCFGRNVVVGKAEFCFLFLVSSGGEVEAVVAIIRWL